MQQGWTGFVCYGLRAACHRGYAMLIVAGYTPLMNTQYTETERGEDGSERVNERLGGGR